MRPYKDQKSSFCQKNLVLNAFTDLIRNADTKYILLSYNDEGLLNEEEISEILSSRGDTQIFEKEYRRYKSINQNESDRRTVKEKLYFVKVNR